jgi:hypothetical protein
MAMEFIDQILPFSPFILGGIGYAIHNEKRMTQIESSDKTLKEKVDNVDKKVDKIYELLMQEAIAKKTKPPDRKQT